MCLLAVDWPLGWRVVPIAAVWTLIWPAGRRCLCLGGIRAPRRIRRTIGGHWSLEDGRGLHYVELIALPTRLGPLFWFGFRSRAGRWRICLDAKVMEPLELRTLQLMIRESPVT